MNVRNKLKKLVDKHCNNVKVKREKIEKINPRVNKINKKPYQR